ncbi:MvdC/MvdD family ATP grasp protein [Dactylosporangium sp. NPDC000555]|uniref:MvdC/MvdD family ATP grasp protein n=1 Tax=Dactylosporangium sp. NPDC000555 TaxID=3154260 RepID=UPI003319D781
MGESRILVVTDYIDAHADRLIALLRERGAEPVRLNSSDLTAGLTGRPPHGVTLHLPEAGKTVDLAGLTSIWWRKPGPFGLRPDLDERQREFAMEETGHAVLGLLGTLGARWVSHPDAIRRAGYKAEQLHRAEALGFTVPRTLITTDPEAARGFLDECGGQTVYKVLSDPYLAASRHAERGGHGRHEHGRHGWHKPPDNLFVATTPVTAATLGDGEAVRAVPCQFQERLPIASELRVTVIGDEVFAAEVVAGTMDWRLPGADATWRAAALPDAVAARCVALTRGYHLEFGAVDLIRTPDGRLVFLEINPNGQFLFVEDRVPELRLGDAMAALLMRGGQA